MNAEQKERALTALGMWRPFLTDVITAAGLLEHGKRDKGLAGRIGKFAFAAIRATHTPAEAPADVARDAERYRWLLKQAWFQQAADRFDLPDCKTVLKSAWMNLSTPP